MGLSQVRTNNGSIVAVNDGSRLIKVVFTKEGLKEIGVIEVGTGGRVVSKGQERQFFELSDGNGTIAAFGPGHIFIDHDLQNVFVEGVDEVIIFIGFERGHIV